MARTYTFEEAVKIIFENEDKEAIVDMARRFPLATLKIVELVSVAGEKFVEFANMVPTYITLSKVNSTAKNSVANDVEETEGTEEEDEAEVTEAEPVAEPVKVEKKTRGRKAKAVEEKPVEEEKEEAATEEDRYEGKNAVELYKMCKERGLNVKSRLKASEYVKALKEADAKATNVEETEDDGWEDDEPEEKPVKATKKEKKQVKQVEEDEDDDSWDI